MTNTIVVSLKKKRAAHPAHRIYGTFFLKAFIHKDSVENIFKILCKDLLKMKDDVTHL